MEIRQLAYFVEIAKDGNYTRTAKKLFVSQSSLSKSMQKLEAEIGQDLFGPRHNGLSLTYAGQRLFESAERIIQEYESILGELQGPSSNTRGRVTIGIPPLICTCFFAPILAGFRSLYPGIEISIAEKGAKSIQDDVDRELLDIGIVILPVYEGKFDTTSLLSDETVLVVSVNHPLADRSEVTYEDLKNEKFVIFNEEYVLYHQITANCRAAGFEPFIWAVSGQWDYLIELAALQLGVSVMPRPIFKKEMRDDIRLIPIRHPMSGWHVVAITKKGRRKTGAVKRFIEYTKENILL